MSEKFVDAPPAGADGWREVWSEDRRFRPAASRWEWLLGAVRRIVRKLSEADAERQRNFNIALLDLVADQQRAMQRALEQAASDLDAVRSALQRDIRTADGALAADIARTNAVIPVASKRNDALVAALDQKIETIAVRLRDLTNLPASGVLRQSAAIDPADLLYRRLEDGLRGSEADVRAAVEPYVELARTHQPLFDAGCGRGELLAACRAAGIDAHGCDTNERSVADLQQRGLDVTLAAIPECFAAIGDASLGSIAAMHVVEHLPIEALFALYREAARTLRPGGLLMVETPNAESLFVSASRFWRDPTHLAPRHPAALVLLGREHGFDVHEVRAVHEFPPGTAIATAEGDPPALRRVTAALNELLFAPQDLRLVMRRVKSEG